MTRRSRSTRRLRAAAEAERVRRWRETHAADPEFAERNRLRQLFRLYGLDPDQAHTLFDAFYHRCAICGEPETAVSRTGRPKSISVDHDHDTGRIRGVLCDRCNRALWYLRDNPDLLRRAADYLERPPWEDLGAAA